LPWACLEYAPESGFQTLCAEIRIHSRRN
jgi:hypothetical protein